MLSEGSLHNVTLTYAIFAHGVDGAGVLQQNSAQRTTSSQILQDLSAQPLRLTWLEHSRRKEEMETKPTFETVSCTQTYSYETIRITSFKGPEISALPSIEATPDPARLSGPHLQHS